MATAPASFGHDWNCCRCIGRNLESIQFKWRRRRYLWRASFYYSCISWIFVLGIILTFTFHYLITKFSFFVNYSCSSRSIRIISWYIATQLLVTGIILMISIFLARMCNIFSNYTLSDFISTGKWLDFFGCTVKWLPWLMAFLMGTLIIIQFSSLIWIFANPRQWCANRLNESAVNAVRNCRLILTGRTPCRINWKTTIHKEIRECNSPDYLIKRRMLLLALSETDGSCSVEDPAVCNAFLDVLNGEDVDWSVPSLSGCLGYAPTSIEEFIDRKNSSDLYKYSLLFNITWSIAYVVIVCFFYFVKSVTEFDAIIYQPKDPSENIMIKIVRPLTPWSK